MTTSASDYLLRLFIFCWACPSHGCRDRKSTRLNSSHGYISYAVFCLKKKKQQVLLEQVGHNIAEWMRTESRLKHGDLAQSTLRRRIPNHYRRCMNTQLDIRTTQQTY